MQLGDHSFFKTRAILNTTSQSRRILMRAIFLALIFGWIFWFFFVPIGLSHQSFSGFLHSENRVLASFSPQARDDLFTGQKAKIILADFPEALYGSIPGVIKKIDPTIRDGRISVEIALDPQTTLIPLQRGLSVVVQVVIENQSPATIIWMKTRNGLYP